MSVLTGLYVGGFFGPRHRLDFTYASVPATAWDSAQMKIEQKPMTLTVATRSGALQVTSNRGSGYAMTTWDGNADLACRINAYNSAANTSAAGGIQGLSVYVRQYSGGQICNMYGAVISVDERGSGASPSCANAITLTASMRINGVCTASNVLVVEDNSQGTIQTSSGTANSMIKIRSTQPIASGAKFAGIHFETSGSGSGWTYAFSFQTASGKEGFTAVAGGAQGGNVDGYIKIYDTATGQALYIPCYDAAPA